ncbi:MAG: DMT family transporter [Fervidobacterium sp.]|uniref:DMT family transporter n=1 Tax=Fervidobacterium TaxID=2422 RepID=UPI002481C7C7|nr:DMT family transporter [Fervidobacterium gondwanense]
MNLLALVIVWGSYYITNKFALTTYSVVFTGIFIRTFVLFLMLFVGFLSKKSYELLRLKNIFPRLVLIGLLGFALDITAFLGFKYSSASKGAVLLRTDVLFSTVISAFLGQMPGVMDILSMVLMLFGVALVSGSGSIFKLAYGDVFFLLSAFFISLNAFVIRSVQEDKKNPASDFVIAFYNNFFTLVFFSIFSLNNLVNEVALGLSNFGLKASTTGLVMASILQYLIYVVYYRNLRIFPVWLVRTSLLFMPVYVLIVMSLFGEAVNTKQIIGVVIVLFGAFILTMSNYFRKSKRG